MNSVPAYDTPARLCLKRGEDRRLAAGHAWVFSNEVDTDRTPLAAFEPGDLAAVESDRGRFLGYAYVNPHALICARIMSRDARAPIDEALLARRLAGALELRRRLSAEPYYRLVYGESDGLPGLVLDRYGELIVGQIATAGMEALRPRIEKAVQTVLAPAALYWKNDSAARALEELPLLAAPAFGPVPEEVAVREAGALFQAPLARGQKTGWFYDQTANRARMLRYLRPGARVLDVFSYVGAWAVLALRAGAAAATCIDSSKEALEHAGRNAAQNGTTLEAVHEDAFDALHALGESRARFDVIILDPPAFIKRKKDIPKGQAAYRKLNQLALKLTERDALLISCSCSYHLPEAELLAAVQAAGRHCERFVQVLELGGQSPDHPLHPAIPETRYLKAVFCRVTRD
ncbi:MAG TPA: class I SAM-dependent rRNA methyltransferase [Steroidobacteraceae bacterium]|nr:class I SAM-dependent rRNA methyltransferase [Steroidobacteraceae bacterium]